MAIYALTTADTFEHVLDIDPAKKVTKVPVDPADPAKGMKDEVTIGEDATVFILSPLDVFLMGYIYDNANSLTGEGGSNKVDIRTQVNKTNIDAVRFGLRGFRNFKDKNGIEQRASYEEVEVNGQKYTAATAKTLSLIGVRAMAELAGQIKEKSEVSGSVEKN